MWVKSIQLQSVRSFINYKFDFSQKINVLIGPNNAGKSTVLLPLLGLQEGLPALDEKDVRFNCPTSRVNLEFGGQLPVVFDGCRGFRYEYPGLKATPSGFPLLGDISKTPGGTTTRKLKKIPSSEPNNFVVPFLSGRWGAPRLSDAGSLNAHAVHPDLRNVDAKIDMASTSQLEPVRGFYDKGCMRTLGRLIVPIPAEGGRQAVYTINDQCSVPLDRMGSGSRNIAGLLALMAYAKGKLFVIEEPENDIHPEALRQLLHSVVEASASNQFIIATHSHIVLNVLAAEPSTMIWYVDIDFPDRVPTSSVEEVGEDTDDRLRVLRQLGYEFADMSLWNAWLVLEESSAEKIIRDFLIPWFTPDLCGRLRTYSAGSLSEVEGRFKALNELFVFLHLTPTYKNRAWVVVDAGEDEQRIIKQLKDRYEPSDWKGEQFRQWSKHDFEDYYPARFGDEWTRIRDIPAGKEKMAAKKTLLHEVLEWIGEEKEQAKTEFAESAADVITVLNEISDALRGDAGETSS